MQGQHTLLSRATWSSDRDLTGTRESSGDASRAWLVFFKPWLSFNALAANIMSRVNHRGKWPVHLLAIAAATSTC
jgi:hypothetical protein